MARILLVDDDELIRRVVHPMLSRDGHEVVEQSSGREAIQAAAEERFDLAIVDVIMPDKGGLETTLELRQALARLPVILITGKVTVDTEVFQRLSTSLGARTVLVKPFSAQQLLAAVRQALS